MFLFFVFRGGKSKKKSSYMRDEILYIEDKRNVRFTANNHTQRECRKGKMLGKHWQIKKEKRDERKSQLENQSVSRLRIFKVLVPMLFILGRGKNVYWFRNEEETETFKLNRYLVLLLLVSLFSTTKKRKKKLSRSVLHKNSITSHEKLKIHRRNVYRTGEEIKLGKISFIAFNAHPILILLLVILLLWAGCKKGSSEEREWGEVVDGRKIEKFNERMKLIRCKRVDVSGGYFQCSQNWKETLELWRECEMNVEQTKMSPAVGEKSWMWCG